MKYRLILAVLIMLTALSVSAQSAVIRVKWDSPNNGPGNDWYHAYWTVQGGLSAAIAGDEVWVAGDSEHPYLECIELKDGVGLYGGFAGTETARDQRNWTLNVTILDGNQASNVVTAPWGATTSTVIDGFTIRNGCDGGIYCYQSSPTISNNTITGNDAVFGGGICVEDCSPTIVNNKIIGNYAYWHGGGIRCRSGYGYETSPTIANNIITGNSTSGFGGGIFCVSCTNPKIANNTITENIALCDGGGVYCGSCANLEVVNNTIAENGGPHGGGVYCGNCTNLKLVNNTIVENSASYGGGVYCNYSSPTIANNIVAFNSSGIYNTEGSPVLSHNDVFGNTSYNYSGLSPGTGDVSEDPRLAPDGVHIQPSLPCLNAGDNNEVGQGWVDIDGQARIQDGTVDIGADESNGCIWYALTVNACPEYPEAPGRTTVTANVFNPVSSEPVENWRVDFSVADGQLVSISNGTVNQPERTTGYGMTDADGNVYAIVERATPGSATVTAWISQPCGGVLTKTITVYFGTSISDSWPMFMHDPQHTGASHRWDTASTENLDLQWEVLVATAYTGRYNWPDHPSTRGAGSYIFPHPYIDSSPVHAPGCPVIVGAWYSGSYTDPVTYGYVVAFNPTTGQQVWRYPDTGFIGAVASTPCIADVNSQKLVYFGSMDGRVYCLNAQTGGFIWSFQTSSRGQESPRILASPTVYNGRVYIGNESARIYCLDAASGAEKWSHNLPADGTWPDRTGVSSVAIGIVNSEARAYVGCDNRHMYCLSTADNPENRVIWDYAKEDSFGLGCVESSPTVYGGTVYVGTSWWMGTDLVALNAETGQLVWRRGLGEEVRATCAAADGAIYVGCDTGHDFFKLDASNGNTMSVLSLYAENYFVGSAALCSAGLAYVGNDNGNFYALRRSNVSQVVNTYATGAFVCSSPAISYAAEAGARWVYVVRRGGKLLAFRTRVPIEWPSVDDAKKAADGTWGTVSGKLVTAVFYNDSGSRIGFAIEEPDRFSGIRVVSDAEVRVGDRVTVDGTAAMESGERIIQATSVVVTSSGYELAPFSIANIDTGGGDYGGQEAVVNDATTSPPTMCVGMNNVGILMTIRGKVRAVVDDDTYNGYFYVDDAYGNLDWGYETGLKDGSSTGSDLNIGIRCRPAPDAQGEPGTLPAVGDYVEVIGVMGVRQINSINARYMWTKTWSAATFEEDPYSYDYYEEWNLLSLPGQPKNPDPAVIFGSPDVIDGRLYRWDALGQGTLVYDIWSPDLFGAMNNSEGYWLNAAEEGTVSYEGYTESTLDRWISAPNGWKLMGMPFTHSTMWPDWKATDGTAMKSIYDASQWGAGWMSSIGFFWDPVGQGTLDFGLEDDWAYTSQLDPWYGYWVETNKHLGLVAPEDSYPE